MKRRLQVCLVVALFASSVHLKAQLNYPAQLEVNLGPLAIDADDGASFNFDGINPYIADYKIK